MTEKPTTTTRLAMGVTLKAPPSELTFDHHYAVLTLVAGLYAGTGDSLKECDDISMFRRASDDILTDLSNLFVLSNKKTPINSTPKLASRFFTLNKRLSNLQRLLNVWTPADRWTNCIMKSEHAWQRYNKQLIATNPDHAQLFQQMITKSKSRQLQVENQRSALKRGDDKLKANYAVPVRLGSGAA